jgi:hypothetical protein
VAATPQTAYEVVKQSIEVLEFFEQFYASSEPYQQKRQEVIALLRNRAEYFKSKSQYGDYKFLMLFAATLEVSNKPGEYVPYAGASA